MALTRTHLENTTTLNPVALFEVEQTKRTVILFQISSGRCPGPTRDSFEIGSNAILTFESMPDFEAPGDANRNNVYEVTVQSTDSGANTGSLDITVTVGNVEEPGVVTLSNLQPEDDIAITATLTDPDGGITDLEWQWQAGESDIERSNICDLQADCGDRSDDQYP